MVYKNTLTAIHNKFQARNRPTSYEAVRGGEPICD